MNALKDTCKTCLHRDTSKKNGEWFCKLNSIHDLIGQGYKVDDKTSYEDFVCDDYEPP
jgi:hypothetical protein